MKEILANLPKFGVEVDWDSPRKEIEAEHQGALLTLRAEINQHNLEKAIPRVGELAQQASEKPKVARP